LQDIGGNEQRIKKEELKQIYTREIDALATKVSEMMVASLSQEQYTGKHHIYINIQKKSEEDVLLFIFKAFLQHFDYPMEQVIIQYSDLIKYEEYRCMMEKIMKEKKQKEIVLLFDNVEKLSSEEQQSINDMIVAK
jgi:hypothetical protein